MTWVVVVVVVVVRAGIVEKSQAKAVMMIWGVLGGWLC
jgi:hypothetical protein